MLRADWKSAPEGITVPYGPIFDNIRKNNGFVDLRARPDLASDIAEGIECESLMELLISLARADSPVFSLGCDIGNHIDPDGGDDDRFVAGGYVQVVDNRYTAPSPDDYLKYTYRVADAVDAQSESHNWLLRFVLTSVAFKLDRCDELIPSVWIWFYAAANSTPAALRSRDKLIKELGIAVRQAVF